ncbi:MAG: hypothetical protein JWM71_1072, partial [Solirubrobacteraceae bacterium]|nr:hypothetical protein [Solirubrobacteraceae bacterium]
RLLAKNMRAVALHADDDRIARARERAERRHQPPPEDGQVRMNLGRDRSTPPRWETPELRRRRVRDELLRRGEHPGLGADVFRAAWEAAKRHEDGQLPHNDPAGYRLPDGLTDRVQHYQREIADGLWTLPAGWPYQRPSS